jgi:hypothetical protein
VPIFFGVVGVLFIVAGARGQSSNLYALIKSDFSGQPNYFEWMIAIFIVGAIGYVKELSTISRMFMFIVLLGLLYKNKQVFSELSAQEKATPQPSGNATQNTPSTSTLGTLPQLPTLPQDLSNNMMGAIVDGVPGYINRTTNVFTPQ